MFKTIKAENVQYRTPLAYKSSPDAQPIFGTAYKRQPGVVTIALANRAHVDVRNDEKVTVSYTPEQEEGVKYLRQCKKCETPHLRRILTDKHATAYCDASAKLFRQNAKTGESERAKTTAVKEATREARIESVMTSKPKSRDYLVAVVLRNSAQWPARFADNAKAYGLTFEEAAAKVEYHFGVTLAA